MGHPASLIERSCGILLKTIQGLRIGSHSGGGFETVGFECLVFVSSRQGTSNIDHIALHDMVLQSITACYFLKLLLSKAKPRSTVASTAHNPAKSFKHGLYSPAYTQDLQSQQELECKNLDIPSIYLNLNSG